MPPVKHQHTDSSIRYRLDQWLTTRMQLLWVYERDLAGQDLQESNYDLHSVIQVRSGWMEAGRSRQTMIRVEPGGWLILHQGTRCQHFSKSCRVFSAGFRFQLPTGEPVFDQGLPLRIPANTEPALDLASARLKKATAKSVGLGYSAGDRIVKMADYLIWQQSFQNFMGVIADIMQRHQIPARSMSALHPAVVTVLQQIENPTQRQGLSPTELAAQLGLSSTHLDRLMVKETGHTIHRHLELRRMRLAQDALRNAALSLKEIAYQLGFSSPSHFHAWFKKKHGITPGQVRQQEGFLNS